MIDTIVLMLKHPTFRITNHSLFSPSTAELYDVKGKPYRQVGRSHVVYKQNPPKGSPVYKPRLTVTKRMTRGGGIEITLKIEFSVPKLLYGNNFDEITDQDFDKVIETLQARLKGMGVRVFKTLLGNAPVSAIHYSKNIPLTDYSTPYTYTEHIGKANMNKMLDINKTDFRNGGQCLKFHANSFEIVFYDKIQDLRQGKYSDKRAIEKDNQIQLNLLDTLEKMQPLEVLKMEIRLNKKWKIKQILKKIKVEKELTFKDLANSDLSKKVLLYHLDMIEKASLPLLDHQSNCLQDLFEEILIKNPQIRISKALKLLGAGGLLREIGTRRFREQVGNSAWYALNKEVKQLKFRRNKINPLDKLRTVIEEMEPTKMADLDKHMLNDVKYD